MIKNELLPSVVNLFNVLSKNIQHHFLVYKEYSSEQRRSNNSFDDQYHNFVSGSPFSHQPRFVKVGRVTTSLVTLE